MKKPDKKLLLIALIIIMGILCVISIVGKMSDQKESRFVLQEKQTWIKELGLEEIPEEIKSALNDPAVIKHAYNAAFE